MSGSLTLTYGNQNITLDFGELEDFPEKTESWTWISLRKR